MEFSNFGGGVDFLLPLSNLLYIEVVVYYECEQFLIFWMRQQFQKNVITYKRHISYLLSIK